MERRAFFRLILACTTALLIAVLAGCATMRETQPPRTATEQLLISTAAARAAAQLQPTLPAGSKVFLDTQFYDTDQVVEPKYTIAAVREQLLRLGAHLVADRKDADVVVELRSGAQSIDSSEFLVGIPTFSFPIPFVGAFTFPEIPFFKIARRTGISKLALVAYGTPNGEPIAATGHHFGQSHLNKYNLLIFSWTRQDIYPP